MINTDKYETKKKRNWKLKVTYPDTDNSVEAFNGCDTDMVPQGYEDIIAVDSLGRWRYTVAQMVDTGWEDAQLIADAPLLLEEIKRLRKALKEANELEWQRREWVENYLHSKGMSCADVAQGLENFENYRSE